MRRMLILSLALGGLVACNLGPTGEDPDDTNDPNNNNGGGATIADIQQGVYVDEDEVTLKGVLVTSGPTYDAEGFYIQDAGGGEWSGIYVYMPAGLPFLTVGDELTVSGTVSEFYDWTEFSVADDSAIEITGSGSVTVDSIDPASLSDMEPWESCLVSVGAVEVTGNVDGYGEATLDNGLELDNQFFNYEAEAGATFTNVTGPIYYAYEKWRIAPRDEADLEGYEPGPEPEPTTVASLQDGTIATGSAVILENVVVTAPAYEYDGEVKGFWIADDGGSDAYNGVYVYTPGLTDTVEVGMLIEKVEATVDEYYDLTELKDVTLTWGSGTGTVAPAVVSDVSDWEVYEGVLIQTELTVTSDENEYGEFATDAGIDLDDLLMDISGEFNDGVGYYVTGVVTYSFSEWKLLPRTSDDIGYTD
jgi:hypothetical protein